MEDENLCSSLPDITDSVLKRPQQDSCTSIDHQHINGEQETIVWGETEMQINQSHGTDQLSLSLKLGRESPEEAEQWEQIVWPMSCTSPPLSFATVQWDMPGPSEVKPLFMIESTLDSEQDSGGLTALDTTSPLLHKTEDINAELFMPEKRDEQDGFEFLHWAGNGSEPCDAADVQEPTIQEKEDSTHELYSKNGSPPRTDSEEEEGHSVTSEPVENVDLINTLEDIEGAEDDVDSFVDLKLKEERVEPSVLLSGQGNSEEEQTSANSVETEEENEECEVEDQSVTHVFGNEENEEAVTVSDPSVVEVPVEPLQINDTGLNVNPDKLFDLLQSEPPPESGHLGNEEDTEILDQLQEDPTGQTEDLEMLKDVDHNIDPEQSSTADDKQGASIQVAERAERIEDSQEILELSEILEETSCSELQNCDRATTDDRELSPQPEHSECEQLEMTREREQIQAEASNQTEGQYSEEPEQLRHSQHLDQSVMELTEESAQPENADEAAESTQSEEIVCVEAEKSEISDQQEQMETQTGQNKQLLQTVDVPQSIQVTQQAEVLNQVDEQADEVKGVGDTEDGDVQTAVANGEQSEILDTAVPHMNGGEVDRQMARRLAEQLYKLDGIQRVDVVKHLDKDNNFSHAVGEEYLKFFDFTGQSLDHALRSFLKVVILIGETQERERVLQHFACRFHECNPNTFSSSGAVLALTCALMLLNTDLHGQHVGKSMSSSKFVSNLDGMNEGENFSKDLLKSLYNSIKSEPLEWAVDEEELKSSVLLEEDAGDDAPRRSKSNPFLDVPHDKKASVVKEGFLQRKLHADIDGKRTPWGKRGWKTFYGVLRGMVLYLQKDDYRKDQQTNEEVVSVHHSLAEQAANYTKKPHVFRLQTADWRVFLFQVSSKVEMNSWISRINLVSALHSSPPFPAAVGSQRKFFRPILPASQSAHTLERQLQSHTGMLDSFKADLSNLQQKPPEGRKARAKELEELRVRAEYLQHEMTRYEIYIEVLNGWKRVEKTGTDVLSSAEMNLFDKAMCANSMEEDEEEDGSLKKSHSSPSLELDLAPPTVIKVRRNISERRTYRKTIIPRWNKEV